MSEDEKTTNGMPDTPAEPSKKQDRKEYMARYYAENKEEIAIRRKAARMARQEEATAAERNRYANDPAFQEYRKNMSASERKKKKELIATDPEAKKRNEERLAKRRQRHKERLATDPDYRKKREDYTTAVREKRQKQKNEGDDEP